MVALMQEFDVDVVGMGFVLSRDKQDDRLVSGAKALMTFSMDDEDEQPVVKPASWLSE